MTLDHFNMKNMPYLIQTGSFRNSILDSKSGIDRIIKFDYMGSSEFEFGALSASLRRIRNNLDEYRLLPVQKFPVEGIKFGQNNDLVNINGERLLLFAREDQREVAHEAISLLIKDKLSLKERARIKDHFNPKAIMPSIAQLKKKGTFIRKYLGERMYNLGDTHYLIDEKSNVYSNQYDTSVNFWWSIDHNWMMFFENKKNIENFNAAIRAQKPVAV